MSSGGGGGGSGVPADTTNVQTIREAPEIEARRLGLMDAATELAKKQTTLPAYQVAAMTTPETEARTLARSGMAGQQQITDATTAASGAQTAAGQTFTAAQVQAAMNPYIQNVVNRVSDDYAAKENQLAANAIQSGNFGGGREGVGIAELQRQKADTLGGIYGTGYQSALGELQTQRALETQTGIQAGEINLNAANIAQQGRSGQLQGLMGTGGVERGVNQAALEAQRQTALQNIQEPYQRVAFVSDIQSGVPSSSQQRIAQTRAPQPSPLGQAVGTGIGAYAAFTGG
tara:strand:+ start:692 stop:1555 length:864 start_codon:yes stop_codon:yes gene_type:complete